MDSIQETQIQSLLQLIDEKHHQDAKEIIESMLNKQNSGLLGQVEDIANNLHSTLDSFGADASIIRHAKLDLPDTSERLEYVINETKTASDKTLSSAENILAVLDSIESNVTDDTTKALISQAQDEVIAIMTAQSFQDLTGQVLNRIIMVVTTLEQSLHELISSAGIDIEAIKIEQTEEEKRKQEMKGVGPDVTKSSQDDVDDLLADLGI
jgi:chemotaxis protein CheZ